MLRILVANIRVPRNRYLADLNGALSQFCEVTQSSDAFWNMHGDYDVVHVHWPEYLTYEIESAYNTGLTEELIDRTVKRFRFWAKRSSIVVTRHNVLPHNAANDPLWAKLYELVFDYTAGVVHMGEESLRDFQRRYPRFGGSGDLEHTVIPHQNYSSLPNTVTKADSRKKLSIDDASSVMLVFGAIRGKSEKELILKAFRTAVAPDKVLLASNWPLRFRKTKGAPGRVIRAIEKGYFRARQFRFHYGFVSDEETQLYMNAADILFIPRLRVLNSGNVSLGMSFGRVVVGPNVGTVGEILHQTGNPVFDPFSLDSVAEAVTQGFCAAAGGELGRRNRELALGEWTPARCAAMYADFFSTLAKDRKLRLSVSG